ncbi:redoxin family protein [Parasphingopyxis sp. GrpM-11]|uniref:Redoxin family protein n=2 Tax=Parasphingopyxis marina TaxID=2761622 RepID=A0A842HZU3_9SPHN|nr:redoxin family protein [Parasphingopyxis marina]
MAAPTETPTAKKKHLVLWVPLAFAVIFFGFFAYALYFGTDSPQQRAIESQMVGEQVPEMDLDPAVPGRPGLRTADLATGEPKLLNVFASWCVPCITEAPQLMQLQNAGVTIEAIAIRDRPQDVYGFLQRWGDPFNRIGADPNSQAQLALGSSGVPETFVIDGNGVIVHQHIGEIRPENVPEILNALENAR